MHDAFFQYKYILQYNLKALFHLTDSVSRWESPKFRFICYIRLLKAGVALFSLGTKHWLRRGMAHPGGI